MRQHRLCQIQKLIEGELVSILKEQYSQSVEPGLPIRYYLDFKTDARLVELREVLDRMERGTFGHCALCGIQIPTRILEAAPTRQLCLGCDESSIPDRRHGAHARRGVQLSIKQVIGVEVDAAGSRTRGT
jgi:RNA polymerase-binding transcription factor DksA